MLSDVEGMVQAALTHSFQRCTPRVPIASLQSSMPSIGTRCARRLKRVEHVWSFRRMSNHLGILEDFMTAVG